MIKVLHNKKFLEYSYKECKEISRELLTQVAVIDTDDLEKAFYLSNTIEHSWTENERVSAVSKKLRSSSTGDVLIKDDEAFIVVPMGFQKITLI